MSKYKKLDSKWIDEHRKSYTMEDSVEISELQNLLVPKQELPVIPKYVADWFEENKEHFEDRIKSAIKYREINDDPSEFDVWLDNPHNKPLQTLGNMFNGYEVEEEQKYYVINRENYFLLAKDKWNGFIFSTGGISRLGGSMNSSATFELTEQEVKDYDPRYMAFAKPVEELEE